MLTWHLLEDALGWVAVLIASIVLLFVDYPILDLILAIAITLFVSVFVIRKMVQTFQIFLQKVPAKVNLEALKQKILCLPHIKDVKHFHIWSLDGKKMVVSMHVLVTDVQHLQQTEELKSKI